MTIASMLAGIFQSLLDLRARAGGWFRRSRPGGSRVRWLFTLGILIGACGCGPLIEGESDEQKNPHFITGKNRLSSMDWKGAIESFEKALEANPRSGAAHFELGLLYEQRINDYATAIYHYQKHLLLRPNSNVAGTVRERINSCKVELAKTVSFSLVNQQVHAQLDRLTTENTALRQQVDQLRAQLAQRQSASPNPSVSPAPQTPAPAVSSGSSSGSSQASPILSQSVSEQTRTGGAYRTHSIRRGETMHAIARRYHVDPNDLIAANPHIVPRKMQPGQIVRIPPPRN